MRNLLFIFIASCLLQGCSIWEQFKESTGITPETSSIELHIDTASLINLRSNGQSSPVILRIHELTSPILFRSLDFFALFENDKDALGDEYIKRYEFEIQPNEKIHEIIKLDPMTRAIGFSAAFRNIDGSSWRQLEIIEEKTNYFLKLHIEGSELTTGSTRGIEQNYF
ncbi:type VI secretion system lipoprotein TssJ [Moritella sp. 5]|uniref:type VI secretion system lipoprotein TssJ n=1 Tax=Moritella sp. 5 TaxID=2746231 RepID=UPI001BA8A852|nr:type VI secretion system lipoprotein TssJ [Moritella sp. 5]QUM80168.1 type VI secretion system lipoprotein TssJ [Moritella sp. 5]